MRRSTNIVTMLSAMATGLLLGFLFAPDNGRKTRENISKKSQDFAGMASKKFDEIMEKISGTYEEIEAETSDLAYRAKKEAKETADDNISS